MMVCVGSTATSGDGQEEIVLRDDIGFAQGELPVEDIEEFPFDATDITFTKNSGPCRPIGILR